MSPRSADGLGTQLRRLLELLDGELEALYRDEHPFYGPRYTPVMKALAEAGDLTIKEIAERSSVSHSAASQTVSKLAGHGLVSLEPDEDRRGRRVRLTSEGEALLPWLRRRWAATNAAAQELDGELDDPLTTVLAQAILRLEQRSFSERIRRHEEGSGGQA